MMSSQAPHSSWITTVVRILDFQIYIFFIVGARGRLCPIESFAVCSHIFWGVHFFLGSHFSVSVFWTYLCCLTEEVEPIEWQSESAKIFSTYTIYKNFMYEHMNLCVIYI